LIPSSFIIILLYSDFTRLRVGVDRFGIKELYATKAGGEQWLDYSSGNINTPENNWHKVLEYNDEGNWGRGNPTCEGFDNTIITWGGPIAVFSGTT
jgi:hypothetical protein